MNVFPSVPRRVLNQHSFDPNVHQKQCHIAYKFVLFRGVRPVDVEETGFCDRHLTRRVVISNRFACTHKGLASGQEALT